MRWGKILNSATKRLAKMDTFYDLDLAVEVKLSISSAEHAFYRTAVAPVGTSINVGHELRKNSRIYIVAEMLEEHGFGELLDYRLKLLEAMYSCSVETVTRTFDANAIPEDSEATLYDTMYFAMKSYMLGEMPIIQLPIEESSIVASTKYDVVEGNRITFNDRYYTIRDVDRLDEGTNRIKIDQEMRVVS